MRIVHFASPHQWAVKHSDGAQSLIQEMQISVLLKCKFGCARHVAVFVTSAFPVLAHDAVKCQ